MKTAAIGLCIVLCIGILFYLGFRYASMTETETAIDSESTTNQFTPSVDQGWQTSVQIDDFTGETDFYTASGPENKQGNRINLFCQPTRPFIYASLHFATIPKIESAVSWRSAVDDYQVRTRHPVLGIDTIGITQMSSRTFNVSIVDDELFTQVSDSIDIEFSRGDGGTQMFYFVGIEDALSYLRSNCREP